MSKTTRDKLVMSVIAWLLFFLGWWLFGTWEGFMILLSYMIGLLTVVFLAIV